MKESEIRPQVLFNKYLELSQKDAESFDPLSFQNVNCTGCGSDHSSVKFKKNGFDYRLCKTCNSLYCSPRPSEKELKGFYEQSVSAKYWSEVFSPAVAEIRREKLFKKKAKQIHELLKNQKEIPKQICDVGAGYGVFLEEAQKLFVESTFFAVEPSPEQAQQCRKLGFETLEATAENSTEWLEKFDLVISQEVLEHVYSPLNFVQSLHRLTQAGGACLVTGLGYEGFDILSLQKDSNSIFPPHHINFLSIQGAEQLFQRAGFNDVEVWTPGMLDIDIVANSPYCSEFVKVLVQRGEDAIQEFQALLQKYQLSSHLWIYARKIEKGL